MTKTEIMEVVERVERREVDRGLAARMAGGRDKVRQARAEAELTAAFDAFYAAHPFFTETVPQPVPELKGFDGARWVGRFSDSWGEGR